MKKMILAGPDDEGLNINHLGQGLYEVSGYQAHSVFVEGEGTFVPPGSFLLPLQTATAPEAVPVSAVLAILMDHLGEKHAANAHLVKALGTLLPADEAPKKKGRGKKFPEDVKVDDDDDALPLADAIVNDGKEGAE